jgi:hypothetical protein
MPNDDVEVVATLQVVIRRGLRGAGESSLLGKIDNQHFFLVLRPDADKLIIESLKNKSTTNREYAESVIAHELGHFVAYLLNDPSHSKLQKELRIDVPEKKAWHIAEKIGPVSKDIEKDALIGYAKEADQEMVSRQHSLLDEEQLNEALAALRGY